MLNYHIFDSMLDGALVVSKDDTILYSNEVFASICGIPSRRMLQKITSKLLHHIPGLLESIQQIKGGQELAPYIETSFTLPDQVEKKVQISAQPLGENILIFTRDTSLETTLFEKYRGELEQKEDLILQLNRKVFELEFLLGCTSMESNENAGQISLTAVLKKVHKELAADFVSAVTITPNHQGDSVIKNIEAFSDSKDPLIRSEDFFQLEMSRWLGLDLTKTFEKQTLIDEKQESCVITCGIQSRYQEWIIYSFYFEKNKAAAFENIKLLETLTKQTTVLLENQELFNQSITDEKTKLFNQRYLNFRFEQEINRSKRFKQNFALFVFDIDHFKKFNDTHGHLVGDQVLIEVAKVIKNSFRSTDVTARFGGEEFVAIILETNAGNAFDLANRVRKTIQNNTVMTPDGKNLNVTVSIGLAMFPAHGESSKELFELADKALYRAKAKGRNRVEIAVVEPLTKVS